MGNRHDVLIVGAGASGGVAAARLAAGGLRVLCLEQGDWPDTRRFVGRRPDWEVTAEPRWSLDPNTRLLESDYPVDASESDIDPLMWNGVGGSTVLWAASWHRLPPSDFEVRRQDGVAVDWPLSYAELAPYYDEVEAQMGVSGQDGDPAYPPKAPYPLPPMPIGKAGRRMAEGFDRLGWHWWPGSNAVPSRPYRGRNACVRRGLCILGCADGAKASTDLTHWPDAIRDGATLVTGARVREIVLDAAGRARGAVYIDRSGQEHLAEASVVVLCGNGIGTPRLLQLSTSARFPRGLANSSGLVGRGLMVHPIAIVTGTFDDPLESWLGPQGTLIYSMQNYRSDASRGYLRGSKWQLMPHGGPLGFAMGVRDIGSLHAEVARRFGHTLTVMIYAEDLPEDHNRITLDPERTDSDGLPAARMHYRLSDNSRRLLDHNIRDVETALRAAGAAETAAMPLCREFGGAHLLGTARMGDDPETSVVDRWGQAHDVPGLFILDGSIFPTAGAVNPTATICALALRGAERILASRHAPGFAA
jgi:choline dehydrogenase-like flavoprotein